MSVFEPKEMFYVELKEKYEGLEGASFILQNLVYAYKKYLYDPKTPKQYKQRTSAESLYELLKFDRYLLAAYPELTSTKDIQSYHVDNYKRFCQKALGNTNKTINKKIRAIRKFFDYLRDVRREVLDNVTLNVGYFEEFETEQPPHIPKSKLKIITDTLYNFKYGVRDVSITHLIAYIGLGVGESLDLKINSVNLEDKELYVKRGKENIIFPIPDVLYCDLKEYIMIRSELLNDNSDSSLFISNTGHPYAAREYQRKFKSAIIESNMEGHYTPRNVRATFAYYMAKAVPEEKLRVILNQEKVDQYYMEDIISNPLLAI
jgi:site-specific recombinase XerC